MWKLRTPLNLLNGLQPQASSTPTFANLSLSLNDDKYKLQHPIKRINNEHITLLAVPNKEVSHMTKLLKKSGISISSYSKYEPIAKPVYHIHPTTNDVIASPNSSNLATNSSNSNSTSPNKDIFTNNLSPTTSSNDNDSLLSTSPQSTMSSSMTSYSSNSCTNSSNYTEISETSESISSEEIYSSENEQLQTIQDQEKQKNDCISSNPLLQQYATHNTQNNTILYSRFSNEFLIRSTLGKGGFGIVFRVSNKYDEMEYAVKRIIVNREAPSELEEVKTMARLSHPNIVRYYSSWIEPLNQIDHYGELKSYKEQNNLKSYETDEDSLEDSNEEEYESSNSNKKYITFNQQQQQQFNQQQINNNIYSLYIQMEFCKYGSLKTFLNQQNNLNLQNVNFVREVIKQVLIGIKYIHSQGYIHRDLTPDNIFISESPLNIKIGDFGLSTSVESLKKELENTNRKRKGLGTYLYSSIEQEIGEFYDQKTDLYSVGVIFFEMLSQFKTIMERTLLLTQLKENMSIKQTCSNFYQNHVNESKFIDYLIQPHHNRPFSFQIQTDCDYFIENTIVQENL